MAVRRLKVFVVTQDEPVYAPAYLAAILDAADHDFVGVTALSVGGSRGFLAVVRERFDIYGLQDFLRAALLYARNRLTRSVAKVAKARAVPIVECSSVNDATFIAAIRSSDVDVLLSVAANQRFGPELLAAPRVAAVNIHSALLPKYRGLDGLFWALCHGETTVGVTAHLMSERFDEGGILGQTSFPAPPEATLHDLYRAAICHGSALLALVLDQLASKTSEVRPNDPAAGSYFSAPTREAVREFRARGRRFF